MTAVFPFRSALLGRLATAASWSLTGAIAGRLLALVMSIALARVLGVSTFGKWGILQTTTMMFQTAATFGLGTTATKYVAQYKVSNPSRAGAIAGLALVVSIVSGVLVGAVVLALSGPIASTILGSPDLRRPIELSSIVLLLSAISGAQFGVLYGLHRFRLTAALVTLYSALNLLLTPLGAWVAGLTGATIALAVAGAIAGLTNHVMLQRATAAVGVRVTLRSAHQEGRVLVSFSLPATLSGLMVAPIMWVGSTFLARAGGYAEMGLFTAANQWRAAVLFLPGALVSVVLPVIVSAEAESATKPKAVDHRTILGLTVLVAACPAAAIACLASVVMASYGSSFLSGVGTLRLLMASAFLTAVGNLVGQYLAARSRMWSGFLLNVGWAFVFVATAFLFTHRWGAFGLAVSYLLSYAIHTITQVVYVLLAKRLARGR